MAPEFPGFRNFRPVFLRFSPIFPGFGGAVGSGTDGGKMGEFPAKKGEKVDLFAENPVIFQRKSTLT